MEPTELEIAVSAKTADLLKSELSIGGSGSVKLSFRDYGISIKLDHALKDQDVVLLNLSSRRETRDAMAFEFPAGIVPDDVTALVNRAYEEALRSFERGCSLAAIGMCGRSIETLLGALYQKIFGIHPSQEKDKPGINAVITRLKKEGFGFPTGLKDRMELIAKHRNMAVHGNIILPTADEARSILYMTKDVLRMLSVKLADFRA